MFIFNFKVDGNKLGKIFLGVLFALIIVITIIVFFRIFGNNLFKINDSENSNKIQEITNSNYTNVLKEVHDNVEKYVGQKIKFSGYVYRMLDFNQNQFVLARDMIISSDFQTVVVGFLCEYNDIKQYEDCCWIEVEGKITKGNYHGEIPIIEIKKIQKIDKPNSDEYVYPPDDSFVPTSAIL